MIIFTVFCQCYHWSLITGVRRCLVLISNYRFHRSHCCTLQWRHNDHDGVSNHQPHDCLLNRFFRRRSTKTSKLRVTVLCVGNSPGLVNSPHKGPVTQKMFPFDDVIMNLINCIHFDSHSISYVADLQVIVFTFYMNVVMMLQCRCKAYNAI